MALSDPMIWNVQIYHQHAVDNTMVYIPKGNFLISEVIVKALMGTP